MPYSRADKFYPPQVDTPLFLFRETLVSELLRRCASRKPDIVLEAQAGQGKSTLIKQFLDHLGMASAWYQSGPEDADPAFFLVAIQTCIAGLWPDCPSRSRLSNLTGGDIALFDLPKRIDLLLNELDGCLQSDLYLVFDDLHNLLGHESSLFILDYLLENAPERLHFILSSREPLPLAVWQAAPGKGNLIRLGNRELALNASEIADFFQLVFNLNLSGEAISEISALSDGWVMGLVLLGQQMMQQRGLAPPLCWGALGRDDILEYFRGEIFAPLEPKLHGPLLLLSLLEEIPVELAQSLTCQPAIGQELAKLAARNVFIRRLAPDSRLYGLHHLFRQFLREKAEQELSPERIQSVYQQAGLYFFKQGNPAQALSYLMQARDYAGMETVLQKSGTAMLAANQSATLETILSQTPEAELARLGWSAFYLALAQLDFAPSRALPLLSKALAVFSAKRDEPGELLCLAHIISIHITTTGHYREGEELLKRAEQLFARRAESLDASTTILLARSLAMGRCIFLADSETATRYASLALTLARKEQLFNFEAALLMVMGYIQIFAGQMPLSLIWLEQAAAAVLRPEVGSFNRLSIRMMLFNYLFHEGDFANYFAQKGQLVADIGSVLVSQSIAGPFGYVWEMDIAINQGRYEEALALAEQALALFPALSPHLLSQILQLQAVVLASAGQTGQALAASGKAAQLREQSGGLYFLTLNKLLSGLTHGLCGNFELALALLGDGIAKARRMPTPYLEACGLMHRGALHLERQDFAQARQDIESGLGLMRRNAYRHFWAWTPKAIQLVLGFAVSRGLETDYARHLAAQRLGIALRGDGTAIALLEFRTLGGFTIRYQGAAVLNAEDLTPAQRELLCLLLASPGLKMAQDTAQLHFWPDSSAAAAKAKFDTLISRLRKTLAEALPDKAVLEHLKRDKGIIRLEHCKVDALEFQDAVARGLEHTRLREFWQAGNAFCRASALWAGEFAPGVTGEDRVRVFRDGLSKSLTRMALFWCEQLARENRLQGALEFAERALAADPLNDALWALLYRLHGRASAIQARQALKRFAKLLRDEIYPEDEIAELLKGIASAKES